MNVQLALSLLDRNSEVVYNLGCDTDSAFGLLIVCNDKGIRNNLNKYLINNNIYPAILWPDQQTSRDKEISDKILLVHLDFRYNASDVEFITQTINKFFKYEIF